MRKEFPFEKLEIWQDARKLVAGVYPCSRSFPKEERFGLTSPMTRAVVSVANNLVEGSGRSSLKDQAHFSSQAYSSLMETACDLILSNDLGFASSRFTDPILNKAYDLSVRIHNLRSVALPRLETIANNGKPLPTNTNFSFPYAHQLRHHRRHRKLLPVH